MKPLVSVWMVTYNHEKYIRQAIESILSQNVEFTYEIVIGEDCSTDNTRAILKELEAKHPNIIKPIYHVENVGPSRNAYEFVLPACQGKYIAVLEGDDYWTDNNKLQKQIDFLEKNEDYSASGHQSTLIFENSKEPPRLFGETSDTSYNVNDFLQHRKFHTCSLVYRTEIIKSALPFPSKIISADRAIYAMLASHGNIKYFADAMCVYRKHNFGVSTAITVKKLELDLLMLPWLKQHSAKFPVSKLRAFIHLTIFTYPQKTTKCQALKHYALFTFFSFSYFPKNLGDVKWGTIDFFKLLFKKN